MANPLADLDRYLLITADTHAGSSPEGYGPYLEARWQDDFQTWLAHSEQMARIIRQVMGNRSIGVDGDPDEVGDRNWDSARRLRETEADGVVAEVIFPNTSPPFAPAMMSEFGEAEIGKDYDKRWAGIQAHNRWLADFCAEAPGRRAGLVQIFLPFVEESIREIRWAKEHGLTGGVLPISTITDSAARSTRTTSLTNRNMVKASSPSTTIISVVSAIASKLLSSVFLVPSRVSREI